MRQAQWFGPIPVHEKTRRNIFFWRREGRYNRVARLPERKIGPEDWKIVVMPSGRKMFIPIP